MILGEIRPDSRGFAAAVAIAFLAALTLMPGRASADLTDVHLEACIPFPDGRCQQIEQFNPGSPFAIKLSMTVGGEFPRPVGRIYVKAPEGASFGTSGEWTLNIDGTDYPRQPFTSLDDGRIIRATTDVNRVLKPGSKISADFTPSGPIAIAFPPVESYRLAVWTAWEDVPVMSNALTLRAGAVKPSLRTTILGGPSGRTSAKRVTFRFRSRGTASYRCRIDGRKWKTCGSPATFRIPRGQHVFRVRAVSFTGKQGKVAKRTFRRV